MGYVNSPYPLHYWVLGDSSIIDLTCEGSLANTPLVLSNWFFSFVLQVHPLAHMWAINSLTIFMHHQLVPSVGTSDKSYCRFKDKELYGPNTINGHHQPRDRELTQRIRKASANPHHSSWMAHSTKPWVGTIVGATKWSGAKQSEWQIG